jgi:hypothetical protein
MNVVVQGERSKNNLKVDSISLPGSPGRIL